MIIPDIGNRHVLVAIVDEMKYRLKEGFTVRPIDPMLLEFNHLLDEFIARWELDGDQHSFARIFRKRGDENEIS